MGNRRGRAPAWLALGMLALLLASCGQGGTMANSHLTLTVNGAAYLPHVGQIAHGTVLDAAGARTTDGMTLVAMDGTFTLAFGPVLSTGTLYTLDLYVDGPPGMPFGLPSNGQCDPSDHQWRGPLTDPDGTGSYDIDFNLPVSPPPPPATPLTGDLTVNTIHGDFLAFLTGTGAEFCADVNATPP